MDGNGDRASPRSNFRLLEKSLVSSRAPVGAAECHGLLCGILCLNPEASLNDWLDEVLSETAPVEQGDLEVLRDVYNETRRQFDSPDSDFQMLLPDDGGSLVVRSDAMVSWCEGFLYGLGIVGGKVALKMDEASQEFLSDLSEITRLATDAEEGEENEVAYTEIVEYVRTGVMVVREMGLSRQLSSVPRVLH